MGMCVRYLSLIRKFGSSLMLIIKKNLVLKKISNYFGETHTPSENIRVRLSEDFSDVPECYS